MPPKRATPGSSRKRAPSADAGPTSRKRGQPSAGDRSDRQTSVAWGDNDDQSRHHVPRDTRAYSPAKGALRSASRARSHDPEHEHEDEAQAELRRAQRDLEVALRRVEELQDLAGVNASSHAIAMGEDSDASNVTTSDSESEYAGEKYQQNVAIPSSTEILPAKNVFSSGKSSTRGGQVGVSSAGPMTGGRKVSGATQSGGQPLGGNLPGLSFTADSKNKEGILASIFVTKGSFRGFDKDEVLAHNMSILVGRVVSYAGKYFKEPIATDIQLEFFEYVLQKGNEHLIRYLGCLAIAGAQGEESWVELLTEGPTRQALAIGVLGRALKEHVFAELWFGGRDAQVAKIQTLEEDESFENLDGFSRTEKRAEMVKSFVAGKEGKANKTALEKACSGIALRLDAMLEPFLNPANAGDALERQKGLYDIVYFAGRLSRIMRQAPDVVYYWPPTFKDEEFEPSRMECLNLAEMILKSPYEKKEVDGIERAIVRDEDDGENSEAIVKVVCFPGLVAYRQYGGETGRKEMEAEDSRGTVRVPDDVRRARDRRMRNGVEEVADPAAHGFRSRVVCKSVVFLTWGKQRLLTREAGTSAHIDAVREGAAGMQKYEDDYAQYKELYEIAQQQWGVGVDAW